MMVSLTHPTNLIQISISRFSLSMLEAFFLRLMTLPLFSILFRLISSAFVKHGYLLTFQILSLLSQVIFFFDMIVTATVEVLQFMLLHHSIPLSLLLFLLIHLSFCLLLPVSNLILITLHVSIALLLLPLTSNH